jgi:hypothetical protein
MIKEKIRVNKMRKDRFILRKAIKKIRKIVSEEAKELYRSNLNQNNKDLKVAYKRKAIS